MSQAITAHVVLDVVTILRGSILKFGDEFRHLIAEIDSAFGPYAL